LESFLKFRECGMVLEWPRRVAGEAYEGAPCPRPRLASVGGAELRPRRGRDTRQVTFIYHIAAAADWEQARRDGQYTMSTRGRTLAQEGFIHTSTAAQVALVANSFYRDAPDLVLLVIDPDRVTPEIRYEHVPGQDLPYPAHLRAAECRRGRGDPPVPGTTTTITAASKPRAGSCGGLRLPGPGASRYLPVSQAILPILSSGAWLTAREPFLDARRTCALIAGSGNRAASSAGFGSSTDTSPGWPADGE
jgi:uncharacterized protein (DUF952 family)